VVLTLLVGLLSLPPLAEAPKPVPTIQITDVLMGDGKLLIYAKDFRATASQFSISPDGKRLELRGTDTEPATLVSRTGGQQTRLEVTGKRIVFSPGEGTVRVEGAGKIVEAKPK
jgi:hypothetical protein